MIQNTQYVGINQKIPFDVLDTGIYQFLSGIKFNKDSFALHIREFTKGENRVNKAALYTNQIFTTQTIILSYIKEHFKSENYFSLPLQERKAIILCLVSLSFPITYELMVVLASSLKMQETINREAIIQKMALKYGSNRSLYNSMDSLIQMLMEMDKIERVKLGLYKLSSKTVILNPHVIEILVYTDIKLSKSKSILAEDILYRPWYNYFDLSFEPSKKSTLIKISESLVGQGYLTI